MKPGKLALWRGRMRHRGMTHASPLAHLEAEAN
jgi:hypothetical protein